MTAPDRPVYVLALASTAIAAAIALVALGGHAHVQDEAAYLFQARLLASGQLTTGASPLGATVPLTVVNAAGRWFGAFPSGWPAVLAIGVGLGRILGFPEVSDPIPHLVNPVLTGLAVWRAAALARRVAGPDAAFPAALFLGLSPQVLLLGGSLMSHSLVLLLAVRTLELVQPDDRAGSARGVELGVWLGLCLLTRPLCAVVLGLSLLVWRPAAPWRIAVGPLLMAVAIQVWINLTISGNAAEWPVDTYFRLTVPDRPGCGALGFGADRGCGADSTGHDLAEAWANTRINLVSWAQLLPGPLPLLALASPAGRRLLVPAGGVTLATIAAYALYWYAGTCFGARFYHVAVPLLAVAAAAGLGAVPGRRFVLLAVAAVDLAALARVGPELVNYWGVDDRFVRLQAGWVGPPAAVLVRPEVDDLPTSTPISGVPRTVAPFSIVYREFISSDPEAPVLLGAWSRDAMERARALDRATFLYVLRADPATDELRPVVRDPREGGPDRSAAGREQP